MKLTFTLLSLCLFIPAANAQFSKGSKFIGGTLSGYSTKNNRSGSEMKNTTLVLAPSAAKFYRDNRAFGISLYLSHTFQKDLDDNQAYGAGVFLRQYKSLRNSPFFFFLEEDASARWGKSWYYYYWTGQNYYYQFQESQYVRIGITPGVAYALTDRLLVELSLPSMLAISYLNSKTEKMEATLTHDRDKSFEFSSGFQNMSLSNVNLGIRLLIPARK